MSNVVQLDKFRKHDDDQVSKDRDFEFKTEEERLKELKVRSEQRKLQNSRITRALKLKRANSKSK